MLIPIAPTWLHFSCQCGESEQLIPRLRSDFNNCYFIILRKSNKNEFFKIQVF